MHECTWMLSYKHSDGVTWVYVCTLCGKVEHREYG